MDRFDPSVVCFEIMLKYFGRMDIKTEGIQKVVAGKIKAAGKGANQKEIKEQTRAKIHAAAIKAVDGLMNKLLADTTLNLSSDFTQDEIALIIEDLHKNVRVSEVVVEEISKTTMGLEHGLNTKQFEFVDKIRGLLTYVFEVGSGVGPARLEARRKKIEG